MYTSKAIAMANHAAQHKNKKMRKATVRLLESILASDNQYAKDPTVVTSIDALCRDKDARVRYMAEELRNKHIHTTS